MVLVAKDNSAGNFTILHNRGNGRGEDQTYTYKEFADAWQTHKYFYYITDYSAAARNSDATSGAGTGGTSNSGNSMTAGRTSKPTVSVSNGKAIVSWNYSGNVSRYDVYLVQSPWRWEDIKYQSSTSSASCVFENVAPGNYCAFVVARPNKDSVQSDWTEFTMSTPTKSTVTITFDANGGSVSQNSKAIEAGSRLTGLPTATRSGYKFLGWAVDKIDPDASGFYTTTVVSEGAFSFDKNTTLYAYWDKAQTSCTHVKAEPALTKGEHPHYNYYSCAKCGELFTDGSTSYMEDCPICNPKEQEPDHINPHTHVKKSGRRLTSSEHPHYIKYLCEICGEWFTNNETSTWDSCPICNPPKEPTWSSWSEWSAAPYYESSTRQVETRTVKTSDGATEYRYGRYINSTGGHVCWCSKYLGGKGYTGISIQYSSWSSTRYGTNGKVWTCGYCNGSHTGVDHYDSSGRPCWNEYTLSSGSYFWEESRQTSATYETQYRYRDLISG